MAFLLLLALPLMSAAAAPVEKYPDGYWERGYATGPTQAVSYNVSIKVSDIDKAQGEVSRIMTAAGAALQGSNPYSYGNQSRGRNLSYSIAAGKAEAAAKKLFGVGELHSYNFQRQIQKSTMEEVEKKIQEISAEIEANAAGLKKMPIAAYFLDKQLRRLKQSRDSLQAGLDRAVVSVSLMPVDNEN